LYDAEGELALDAHRIEVTFTSIGEQFVVPVVDGRWAARIHLPEAKGPLTGFRAVIEDSSGEPLGQYTSSL
jgi:hypothetical protein